MEILNGYDQATPLEFDWNVSVAEYRADEALNFHTLLNFRRDPRAFRDGFFERDESDAMRFGTALHALALQGRETFERTVASFEPPVNPKTGEPFGATSKAYSEAREAFEQENQGKTLITRDEYRNVVEMCQEANFHPIAPALLGREPWARSEIPVRGALDVPEYGPVFVKGLIDRYCENGLIDVKTTAQFDDASGRDRFRYIIYDYKYLVQLGFYHLILTDCYGAPFVPAWLLAFEKNPPRRVAVYAITPQVLNDARAVAREWIRSYFVAKRTATYRSKYDEIQTISTYNLEKDL